MKPPLPNKANVCAVVVTFHPDSNLPNRINAIAHQVDSILIVDNASNDQESQMLLHISAEKKAEVMRNPKNVGIAAALNQGIEWAMKRGYSWLLTMDQDSLLLDSVLPAYGRAVESMMDDVNIALVGANYVDKLTGLLLVPAERFNGKNAAHHKDIITSGCLMNLAAVQQIGKFREDYFIDNVDVEYDLRAQRLGFATIITRDAVIEHKIGLPTWHSFLGRRLITRHASTTRRYYVARNHIALLKDYWPSERKLLKELTIIRIKEIILMLLFEEHKLAKVISALQGIFDGLRGKMGPMRG